MGPTSKQPAFTLDVHTERRGRTGKNLHLSMSASRQSGLEEEEEEK